MNKFREKFRNIAQKTATAMGTPWAFLGAVLAIFTWCILGPVFNYSDTWQLVINTGTTIVTFLMVFLIQNSQNRDTKAIHLKLDELLKVNELARNKLVDLENLPESEIEVIDKEFKGLNEETETRHLHIRTKSRDQRD